MAFITAETRSSIVELAMGMLNQAPSTAMLNTLIAKSVEGASIQDLADYIATTDAFTAEYPATQTAREFATEMFGKLITGGTLDADINTAVIDLLEGLLIAGTTKAQGFVAVIEFLANPANVSHPDLGDISQSFQNRADAAEYFSITKELGGSTDAELAAAIASVTSDADTLTAANEAADATADAEEVVAGQTFTLTTGLDTLVGGGANDTISAVDADAIAGAPTTTINAGDSVNAGAGTDKLSIVASRAVAANVTSAELASSTIEEVAIYNNTGGIYTVDTTLMSGLTDLYVVAGTGAVVFDDVNSLPNVHLTAVSNAVTVTNAATVGLGDADAVTIALNGASATNSSILTYNGIETFNVVASGAATGTAVRSQSLVSNQLETVNVSGSAAANITATMTGAATVAQVGTLDASDMTGALVATVNPGVSGLLSVTGGSGNDRLLVNSGAMTDDLTIDGGDGVDTLVVTAAAYDKDSTTGQVGDGVTNMEVLMVAGSASLQAFSNNTFAALVANGSAAITGLGTDAASLTMLSAGAVSLARATDGAADAATVTFGSSGDEFTVTTLGLANEETVTINSASTTDGGGANTINSLTGTDLTSLTIAGTRSLTIGTITGTKLATIDASGLSGTGTQLDISAGNSTADMTVTGAAGVESADGEVMNDITTGSGDDSITVGDYAATIIANNGDNTIVAGDGDNSVTVGKDENTITVGDGDNTIIAGNGDNTITVGGIATSVNSITVGNGDNTITSGAGVDTVTLGSGDDTVDTGAGADKIYMGGYDDDDVINGGAGTDTLSAAVLSTSDQLAGAQIQPSTKFIDVTPGTSKTSSPAFTAVENVYMDVNLSDANISAATGETVDFAASSGISNLYLNITDLDVGAATATLTLSDVDAAAIHLVESGTNENLGTLVIGGTGQASLTVKGHDFDGAVDTALTVTDVDALTLTSYIDSSTAVTGVVGNTAFGAVTADTADTVTVTIADRVAAVGSDTLTVASISADDATAINLNAGKFNTLAIGAGVTSTSDSLETMSITVADDGAMTVGTDIEVTGADMTSATITIGVAGSLTVTDQIDLDAVEDVTVTIGAAGTFDINDFVVDGDVVINATMGSTVTIDVFGESGTTGTFDINGRGTLVNAFAIDGDTTVNTSGFTDTVGAATTVTTNGNDNMTYISNNDDQTVTTGDGDNSITTGSGDDTITLGSGQDTVNVGGGENTIDFTGGGAGAVANIDTVVSFAVSLVAGDVGGDGSADGMDLLIIDDSVAGVAGGAAADGDEILSVGADIADGATLDISTADADAELAVGDVYANVTDGILTLSEQDDTNGGSAQIDTLAEWVAVATLALESYEVVVGTNTDDVAEYAIAFEFGGSTYVMSAQDGNGAADIAVDDIIKLTGVTDVTDVVAGVATAADQILIG